MTTPARVGFNTPAGWVDTLEKLDVLEKIRTNGMTEELLVKFAVLFDVTLPKFYELLQQYDNCWHRTVRGWPSR